MKVFSIILIFLLILSCDDRPSTHFIYNIEQKKQIANYFEADSIFFKTENNSYYIGVHNSRVNNPYLLEHFSKVTALNFYRRVIKQKPEIPFSTNVIVESTGKLSDIYIYELPFLSSAEYGLSMAESVIDSLKNNRIPLKYFLINTKCNDKPIIQNGINWAMTKEIDLISIEDSKFNLCDAILPVILYRINLSPQNIIIWVYYNLEAKKVVAIIRGRD